MAAAAETGYSVLEFELDDKQYCVDLDLVDEIVNNENSITTIPNSAPEVRGVMDLRGKTTQIIDPRIALDLASGADPKYVIVFESEDRPFGWLIEDVTQVTTLEQDHLDESVANESINGVFKHEDTFTVWVDPEDV
jgi:purine-binding chemotaxis protein CheW